MAVNKVVYDGETLIDLTTDTITADKLIEGITAHDKKGNIIVGTYKGYEPENLYYQSTTKDYTSSTGINYYFDTNSTIKLNGTPTSDASTFSNDFSLDLVSGKKYKLSVELIKGSITPNSSTIVSFYLYNRETMLSIAEIRITDINPTNLIFTSNITGTINSAIRTYVYKNNVYNNAEFKIVLSEIEGSEIKLQDKQIEINENGIIEITADDGFDGLSSVEINTNLAIQKYYTGSSQPSSSLGNDGDLYLVV